MPRAAPVVAYPDETLRAAAERMATRRVFVLPVVERETDKVVGLLSAEDVLRGPGADATIAKTSRRACDSRSAGAAIPS